MSQNYRPVRQGLLWATWILAALIPLTGSSQERALAPSEPSFYKIQAGDLLEISVWREEYLERQVIVQPDGRVSFPLVGVLPAAGSTVDEVQLRVAERLSRFIPDPVVTVSIKEIRGNRIYVLGQVKNPGQFIINPRIDVVQALAVAGGTTPFAELNDIKILRRSGERQTLIEFRYGDIARGRNLEQNIMLQSGDVVLVP